MSAITDEPEGHVEPLKVLITMHDGMDSMDVIGTQTLGRTSPLSETSKRSLQWFS